MPLAEQLPLPLPATVTIPKADYDQLVKDSEFLAALEACGVDNWEGYSLASGDDDEELCEGCGETVHCEC